MKKHLLVFAVVLLAIAITAPAFAAVEFKYGGQFRVRLLSENNALDGTENSTLYRSAAGVQTYNGDDNRNFIDQRLRLYFTFVASKNLKLVTKWEVGDQVWGSSSGAIKNIGGGAGGNVGADGVAVEVKNIYAEFNIPNTPSTAIIGIQGLVLMDSWIIDDDFPAAVVVTKLPPFTVTVGYVAGQSGWEGSLTSSPSELQWTNPNYNVDSIFATLDYSEGPFKGSLVFFFQDAHSSDVSINPATLNTPNRTYTGASQGFFAPQWMDNGTWVGNVSARNNYLFDLGLNLQYKVDWLLAYFNFVKNFGSADLREAYVGTTASNPIGSVPLGVPAWSSVDYTGFMFDAGVTYFCGPWTVNVGGFYTTGPDISSTTGFNAAGTGYVTTENGRVFNGISSTDVDWFTYPLATSKYFSEIIGGGIIGDDLYQTRGFNSTSGTKIGTNSMDTVYWRGYGFPTNLWTVTIGGSYQILESTKLSGSYWYFGTAQDVPVAYATRTVNNVVVPDYSRYQMSSSIGHELNFYVDHKIVDGLTLTLVGAYLIADDAFAPLPVNTTVATLNGITSPTASDAYELGARLQWNF
ncbi:MAG: hypothetical protein LLG06_02640 [Desulfobacteraceae bacterium]|nr:hypothetical protein [Desulfobacteraceae bacterium]